MSKRQNKSKQSVVRLKEKFLTDTQKANSIMTNDKYYMEYEGCRKLLDREIRTVKLLLSLSINYSKATGDDSICTSSMLELPIKQSKCINYDKLITHQFHDQIAGKLSNKWNLKPTGLLPENTA